MGMNNKIKSILYSAQQNASCHQRYLKSLETYYNQVSSEDFIEDFLKFLRHIFREDITARNPYVERTLEFLAQFVSAVTKSKENDTNISIEEDSLSHPFLTQVVIETLTFHDLIYEQTRYYSCRFVTLVLQHIGNETHLDNFMCDAIQEAMLQRIMDPKTSIRLQAVMALVRLQEPSNAECPVIKAYISLLMDTNPMIRKEVVKRIAPNSITISKICERVRDVDSHVRMAAYSRCADIGPRLFKIVTRQQILQCGFKDDNKQVKTVFLDNLLPKWVSAYNNNFLHFLSGLKLDADEDDIANTQEVSKQVMDVFFSTFAIKDIIDVLPINNEKLVPLNDLSSEVVTYWSIVTRFLRNSDETEEYLSSILSELTPFCHYIQRIIDSKISKTLEEWEYIEYQYMLYNLLDMAEQYDFSDEIGRRTLYKLITSILQTHKLQFKLAKKIVSIIDKLVSNVDMLTHEICQIISDIREPLVDKPAINCQNRDRDFQVAELKVKINILQGEIEDALDSQDFQKASVIQNEIVEYRKKLDNIEKQSQIVKVRISKDDPETICRCLDLLGAVMELPSVNVLSPSLATCRTEFLLPLLASNNVEINWRVLKCIALYCVLDKNITEEHAKVLCIPIITYRAIPNYNKFALMQSVAALCDLLRMYGPKLFTNEKDTNSSTSVLHNTTRRKLYRNETMDDVIVMDHDRLNVEIIIEIILDMLDDENEDIREIAITAISKLILNEFPVNSSLICRIILKWFNPLEKAIDKTQQKLGSLISNYTKLIKGAKEVIKKAVVPIISSITSAPRTSPLADVEIDNVLQFLSAITNSNDTMDIVHVHTNLAYMLCCSVASKPKDCSVPYLTKMLLYLEIPPESAVAIKELITQIELLLEDEENGIDKASKKNLKKFSEKLKVTIKHPADKHTTENRNKDEQVLNNRDNIAEHLLTQSNSFQETSETAQEIEQVTGENINDNTDKNDYNAKDNMINNRNDKLATIKKNDHISLTGSTEVRKSKRLRVHCNKFITNCDQLGSVVTESKVIANDQTKSNIDGIGNRKKNLHRNIENGCLHSSRLKSIYKKNKQHDVHTNRNINKNISKLNKNKFEQKLNNKSGNKNKESSIVSKGTISNKNENNRFQSAKRKKSGIQIKQTNSHNNKKDVKQCETENKSDLTDMSDSTITDIEEDSQKKLRRSKRQKIQLKSTDTEKENTSKDNRIHNITVSGNKTKETNINTNNLESSTTCMMMTNNSNHGSQNNNINRKELESRMSQDSIASEETILHTIIEHSQQVNMLSVSDTTDYIPPHITSENKSCIPSFSSSNINGSQRNSIVSDTSSESESAPSSTVKMPPRKTKKKSPLHSPINRPVRKIKK